MTTLKTTTALTAAADGSYTDPISGTFTATLLTVADTSAFFYKVDSGLTYSGKISITEGVLAETARIIEVVNSTQAWVEQLVNTVSYTTEALVTPLGYDGTPGVPELAKNSIGMYLYPSKYRADQGINCDRDDIKTLNDSITLGNVFTRNISQGCVLQSSSTAGYVEVVGTSGTPIIFGRGGNLFIEDATKSLNVAGVTSINGFVDIYLQNDSGDTPVVTGSYPIKLVGKFSADTPFTTSASVGQYLIGCCYIYNGTIIGIYSKETAYLPCVNTFAWTDTPLNFTFSGTTYTMASTQTIYIPTFETSIISVNANGCINSDAVAAADEINLDIGLSLNNAAAVDIENFREAPLAVTTKAWRNNFSIHGNYAVSAGLNYFRIAGKKDSGLVGTGKNYYTITRMTARFETYSTKYISNAEA